MDNDINQEIINLKQNIDNLKEYLMSDVCSECGRVALLLESNIQKLDSLQNRLGS